MSFFDRWFQGFDKGLNNLSEEECGRLFRPCASECAKDALRYLYQGLFDDCKGDLDLFFSRLHEVKGVDGRVVEPKRVYEIMFLDCNCDVHTEGHVNSPRLCECSRQSLICELRTLLPEREFTVEKVATILEGSEFCLFRISVNV